MSEQFNPYHIWLGIPPEEQPANYYRLLGLQLFESNTDAISGAADRQMAYVRTFQTGPYSQLSQKILNELSRVRIVLLNPEKKAEYDNKLQNLIDKNNRSRAKKIEPLVRSTIPQPPTPPQTPLRKIEPLVSQIPTSPQLIGTKVQGKKSASTPEVVVRTQTPKISTNSSTLFNVLNATCKNNDSALQSNNPVSKNFIKDDRENNEPYLFPSIELLDLPPYVNCTEFYEPARKVAFCLKRAFQEYGLRIFIHNIQIGPTVTQYQVEPEKGLRVSKIVNLADDLAIKLGTSNIRITFPLFEQQNLIGIEIPNEKKQLVRLRDVMEQLTGTYEDLQIPMFLGKDVAGKPLVADLVTMPHLLIAGCTGAGKSMCINSIITSIVMTRAPENVRLLMIDPRMVEMNQYSIIPHLIVPIVTDMKKAEEILAWAVAKMEERYLWLSRARVRYISDYNKLPYETKVRRAKPKATEKMPEQMPFIVIVVDEMADMMMTAPKEVESHIIRLAQKSRAVGIHLILATQKPIVTVITSLIKSNLPARIAFQVSSKNDSRVVLDENGAERLLGHGDMLFLLPGTSNLIRAQGTYLSDDEINRVVDSISTEEPQFEDEITQHLAGAGGGKIAEWAAKDELYISAIEIIVNERRGSISLLQRMLGIGYGRAARLIDFMEEDKIVGAFNGYTKPRDVLLSKDDWLKMKAEWDNSLKEVHQAEIEHEFMMDIPSNLPIRFSKHNLKGIDNLDRDEECYEEFNEYLEQEISSIPQSSHHSSSDSTERPHRKTRRRQKPNYEQIRPHDVVNHTQQLNDID